MHLLRLVVELELPEDLQVLDVVLGEDVFVLLPVVRCGLPPSVSQSAPYPSPQHSAVIVRIVVFRILIPYLPVNWGWSARKPKV